MGVIRNILVRVGADIAPLQRNMTQAQHSMSGFGTIARTAANNTSLSMRSVVNSLTMGRLGLVALGAAAIASFAVVSKHAISSAMDVVESESLFAVSMGNMADSARQWSNQLQDSLGLNAYQVRENVGLFYNMTTSMGLAQSQAYKVSTSLTQLAYDMSSFYNQSPDEMFAKLQSGLSGEVEPLKRLGIIVNETTSQNYAYANGITKVGATLTEQQKVMARYGVIMEQTKNSQGDLARTITSPANQLRLLQTQIQLASINLGNAFLPIVQRVLPILTDLATRLASVTNTFAQFMSALFGNNSAQAQNALSASKAASAQTALGNATKAAGDKAKNGVSGFDEVNQLQESMAASAADAADAMGNGTTPTPAKQDSGSIIPKGILDAAERAKIALKPVSDAFDKLGESIRNLGKAISENPQIKAWVERTKVQFENIKTGGILILAGSLTTLAGVVNIASGALSGNFEQSIKGAEQVADGASDVMIGAMYPFFPEMAKKMQEFKKDFGEKWASLKEDIKTYGDPTKLEASDFGDYIRDTVSKKWGELKINTSTKWAEIKLTLSEKWEDIKAITWDDIKNTVSTHWEDLKVSSGIKWGELKTTLGTKWETFKTDINWSLIKDTVSNTWTDLKTETDNVWEGIKGTIKGSINSVIEMVNGLIRKLNSISFNVDPLTIAGVTVFGGASLHFPQLPPIPTLAKGGIIKSPTLAMIGEAGTEAVVPLQNTSFVDTLAGAVGSAVLSAMQFAQPQQPSGETGDIVIQVDGVQLARVMIPATYKENLRTGKRAIIQGT